MFSEDFYKQFKKALVLGVGGGNDIASAAFVASYLTNRGVECDVAGILSPGAKHFFNGELEKTVNKLDCEVRRFISTKKPTEISFLDGSLPSWAEETGYDVGNFYSLSLQEGTAVLRDEVNSLIKENGYDLFLGVDVGGDILGRANNDKYLLSPQMDFTSLNLLGNSNIQSYLVEFGLGSDGELRPEGMVEILTELKEKGILLEESKIGMQDPELKQFKGLTEKVFQVRKGHTQVITLQTLEGNQEEDLVTTYRSRYNLGGRAIDNSFEVTIPKETFGKTYLFDAKKLAAERQETAFDYDNPLEQFLRLKGKAPEWKTEMDLCYHEFDGKRVYLLTPSTNVSEVSRQKIIHWGLDNLRLGQADFALLLNKDKYGVDQDLFTTEVGDFIIASALPIRNGMLERQVLEVANG